MHLESVPGLVWREIIGCAVSGAICVSPVTEVLWDVGSDFEATVDHTEPHLFSVPEFWLQENKSGLSLSFWKGGISCLLRCAESFSFCRIHPGSKARHLGD